MAAYYDERYFDGRKDFFRGSSYCDLYNAAIDGGRVTGYVELTEHVSICGRAVLDVGCASGALLQSLRPLEPRVLVGIDIAPVPLRYGIEHYGLDLRETTLEAAGFQTGYFDLVVMIDLIEHIYDLFSFLRETARCLKPGGEVFISTPNAAAYRVAGARSAAFLQNYEHLLYLSEDSLKRAARQHGLQLEQSWTTGCPVLLGEYRYAKLRRPFRLALEPATAARNWLTKLRLREAPKRGEGMQLFAILSKPASRCRTE